jgi:hypothetical protein
MRYELSQHLSGLTPNEFYTLQYSWSLHDNSGIYDGSCDIRVYLDGSEVDSMYIGRPGLDVWAI